MAFQSFENLFFDAIKINGFLYETHGKKSDNALINHSILSKTHTRKMSRSLMVVLILTREEGMLIHRSMPRLPTQKFPDFHQKYGPWIGFLSKLMTLGPPKVAIVIEWCDYKFHFFF